LSQADKSALFEEAIVPHLGAAHNLARWLLRSDADAQDAVQDACVRALRFIGGFRGGDGRLWLLKIVRNVCYSRFERAGPRELESDFDDEAHASDDGAAPETMLQRVRDSAAINSAIAMLPEEFREMIVMRDLEGLSYKQIADIAEVPIGTVMSRLARARKRLRKSLGALDGGGS
jgi:RNA polymerase sigma-70 factor (ECF subfamily)